MTISTGTYPCIFKVGNAFFDYTPFKIAYPYVEIPYFNGQNVDIDSIESDPSALLNFRYMTVFSWCQPISDALTDKSELPPVCTDNANYAAKATPT